MKSKLLLLCRVQLFEQFHFKKGTEKKPLHFWLLAVGILLFVGFLLCYFYGFGVGLVYMGLSEVIPACALALSGLLTLFFTILKTNGILFGVKSHELALPIKTRTVIASRFLLMYLLNLGVSLLVMLPMGLAFLQNQPLPPQSYFFWFIGILLAPLFPTAVASALGALVAWLASKFRHSGALVSIFSIVLILGVMAASFSMTSIREETFVESITQFGQMMGAAINRIYPFAAFFTGAVLYGKLGSFFLFCGISIGMYLLFVSLLSLKYMAINTALATHRARSDYKLTALRGTSPLKALYKKELKRFFGCSIYLVNIGMGVILLLVLSVASLFFTPEALTETIVPGMELTKLVENAIPFVMCGILGMSCTTCVSLSLEGKNIWIVKSLPIAAKTVFQSKMLVNFSILVIPALLSAGLFSVQFATSFSSALCFFLLPLAFCLFVPTFGMLLDIKLCKYDWVSETAIVKQSVNSLVGILGAGISGFVPMLLLIFFPAVNPTFFILFIAAVFLLLAGIFYHKICNSILP